MAYTIISQNNSTTTLSDGVNTITVPSRVNLTSGNFTIVEVNNNMATLEDGDGNVYRDIPCVAVLVGGEGGGDQHNLGWYATESALTTAHPTATAGDWAIVGATDTVWLWDTDNEEWVDSDQKGQVTSVNGQTGDVVLDLLPSQTGQSGKFLTTDGTDASWSDKPLVNVATGTGAIAVSGTGQGNYSVCIGRSTAALGFGTVAIGNGAEARGYGGIAIGQTCHAYAPNSIALLQGQVPSSANNAMMFGLGTNNDANTVKFGNANGNFEMMSADGTIPTARLTKVNTTITLAAADWSSNTQTVTVNGVTSTSVVLVAPDPADTTDYVSAGILCTSQTTNSLTFTATTTPTSDIVVNVVCL